MNYRTFLSFLSLLLISAFPSAAQYYYKDIVGTAETAATMRAYLSNKVRAVSLSGYDGEGEKSDVLSVSQTFDPSALLLRTVTRSEASDPSVLTSFLNDKGQVIKTVDSSEALISTTTYTYNAGGQLEAVLSTTSDTSRAFTEREEHRWEYANGRIHRMLRIKNGTDTILVQFKLDEKGNVTEEQSLRKGILSDPVYYYYDAQDRLTDIVRYNKKARKLLPEYMFEYNSSNQVIQRITVPANGSNYLIWRYQYDNRGLKVKEAVYDRYKQLNGKIEYQYSFGY